MAPARCKQADLGHLLALEALGHGRHGVDVDDGVVARAALDEVDEGDLVDDGIGVRHHDHGGDAAGGRGVAGGLQGFAVLGAGFAGEHLRVDEAGAEHVALAVDDFGALGRVAAQVRAEVGDQAVLDQQPARLVAVRRRIDEARVDEVSRGVGVVPLMAALLVRARREPIYRRCGWVGSCRPTRPGHTWLRRVPRARPCARRRPFRPVRG